MYCVSGGTGATASNDTPSSRVAVTRAVLTPAFLMTTRTLLASEVFRY